MTEQQKSRNPLAVTVAALSLAVQVGAWFYWGGKMETRLDLLEKRVEQAERRQAEATAANSQQDVSIAVITTQLAAIKSTVDSIDRKLGERR